MKKLIIFFFIGAFILSAVEAYAVEGESTHTPNDKEISTASEEVTEKAAEKTEEEATEEATEEAAEEVEEEVAEEIVEEE